MEAHKTHHRQLIRQTLEGTSPGRARAITQSLQSHHVQRTQGPIDFGLIKRFVPEGRSSAAVLALELPQLSK
ncbi:hypothetical protein JTE90_009860 [Oedothorax gibbosus]|uniref:Uncharacterized protein n=1 Tax=Oedothorax gibbosus TaxID=931172 RepID=A0AAV6TER5_9ARAC|nr:hypothetical protein JTE90_009860 [Oedothorax gibbosus]